MSIYANISSQAVTAKSKAIVKAIATRQEYETAKGTGWHIELFKLEKKLENRDIMKAFARLLCLANASPDRIFNYERQVNSRANIKGIVKILNLALYLDNYTGNLDRVTLTLFYLTISSALAGQDYVNNHETELQLFGHSYSTLPPEIAEKLRKIFAARRGVNDCRNEACQFRTAFENLGIFAKESVERGLRTDKGIRIDLESPIVRALIDRWNLSAPVKAKAKRAKKAA